MDKPIFEGLLHTGKPNLEALYRVGYIPMVTRTAGSPAYPGWSDPLGLPTSEWYDAMVAATNPPRNIILMDHEQWPYSTQTERQATAGKYVILYNEIKARRPGWKIGWYADPVRRNFWSSIKDQGSVEFKAWRSEINDLAAIMAPFTDVYLPSLYFHYTRDAAPQNLDWVTTYLITHINEAKRVRRVYGRMESPIYPYIWWRRADDVKDLDADVWETIVRTVLEHADGLVLWGGFKTTAPAGPLPWDENAPWWVTIKARLTDKRRTG